MFMTQPHTKFCMPISCDSLVITIKLKPKENFHMSTTLFF
jgi:hypothetical protein